MNPVKTYLLLVVSFLLLSGSCKKDVPAIAGIAQFEDYIGREMSKQHIPALSALIFKGDSILYEGYFGKSSIEQGVKLESNHLFLLASISKTITGAALLQLYEKGLFSLDDKINDYLPFEVKVPNQSTDITFRMLLTHTSAIADGSALDNQYYYGQDSPVALDYFLENYLVPNGEFFNAKENYYDFEPGTDYEYSNEGSALIAVLVEQISGTDFNTYCKRKIFYPLGMVDTYWRLDEISQTIVQPYKYSKRKYKPIEHYTFTDYPNGGLRCTAQDMFKFLSAFVQNGKSSNYQLLKEETVKEIITPQIPAIDDEVGLHMFLMNKTNNLWGHNGGEQGVSTIMAFNPTTKVGAIVFTNQGDADLDQILVVAYLLGLGL